MPLMFVNPAPRRRRPLHKAMRAGADRGSRSGEGAAENPYTEKSWMPRRRRRKPVAHKIVRRRKRKNPVARKTVRRRRRNPVAAKVVRRRKRRHARRNPMHRKARRVSVVRRARRNPRPTSARALSRARRSIRNKNKTGLAVAYKRKYKMRSNPRKTTPASLKRARASIRSSHKTPTGAAFMAKYRMRSNPSVGDVMALMKQVLPVAGALYGARAISSKVAPKIPMFDKIPAQYQGTAMAGLLLVGGHIATAKVAMLKQHRGSIMVGLGLNLMDALVSAFAPASVKGYFGLADSYGAGLSDYVQVGDYVSVGATPIDDDITLSDYIEVAGVQEELGLEEELGVEEELGGALDREYLGGVGRDSLLRNIPSVPMLAAAPERSFTREVRSAGPGYDKGDVLYTGIFAD